MSSLSMGVVGNRTEHNYFNENTSLILLTSSLMNSLHQVSVQAQDASGQVFIVLIRTPFSSHYNWDKLLVSDDICPYGIMTCPRRIRRNTVIQSFCNGGHRDSTDCIDEKQGQIVCDYIKTINNSIIEDYFERMYATFGDCLKSLRVPLPTTCAWKIIGKPEHYGFKHLSYFVVCGWYFMGLAITYIK